MSYKTTCLLAMFLTAFCTLLCSIQYLQEPNHVMWIHLGITNPDLRKVINVLLLLSALIVLKCAFTWMQKKN